MIENIRKYSGLMIVVFVILFISFFLMDTGSRPSLGGGGTALRIDGRSYSQQDLQRHGDNAFRLLSSLAGQRASQGDFSLYQFLSTMTGAAQTEEEAALNFFTSRMLLREAQEEYGVYPSDANVEEYLRSMPLFAGPDGAFNPAAFRNFVDSSLGRLGMTERDLRSIVSDILVSDRLSNIVGAGLGVDREAIAANKALENQQITAILAKIPLDPYEAAIEPTEEEIKGYWELIQDSFTTPVRRKFTYIIASPAVIEDPVLEEELPDLSATNLDALEAARQEREEAHAAELAKTADARREAQAATAAAVDDFLLNLEGGKPAEFEEIARDAGWEPVTTEFFSVAEPPAELDIPLRDTSGGGRAVAELFGIKRTTDPFSSVSDALPIGESAWLVARIDDEEPSRTKTYAEARDEARAQYIDEKAAEALKAAGEAAIASINEALAAGTPFADAARAADLGDIKEVENVTRFYRPEGETEPQNLFQAASNVDPGSLADLIVESDRAFILYVAKRELVRDENAAASLEAEVANTKTRMQTVAYDAWIRNLIENAKVERVGF